LNPCRSSRLYVLKHSMEPSLRKHKIIERPLLDLAAMFQHDHSISELHHSPSMSDSNHSHITTSSINIAVRHRLAQIATDR
jgi:hypothetical protein